MCRNRVRHQMFEKRGVNVLMKRQSAMFKYDDTDIILTDI